MKENPSHAGAGPASGLYPPIEPFRQQVMEMPGGHRVYVEQCGQPDGAPVVVLHGGPGGGCSPGMRRFFDPQHYRIILFDQRGCGRSSPNACVENNTTWDLVADIERIREALRIERWAVFGGSWGACLALIYAQTHPERVRALVLRGVFTMTRARARLVLRRRRRRLLAGAVGGVRGDDPGGGARRPDRRLPQAAVRRRPGGADPLRAGLGGVGERAGGARSRRGARGYPSSAYSLAFARLENHYFINGGFLDGDGHVLRHMPRIAHIPGLIVQGRYDMICPPHTAFGLHKAWPGSELRMVTHGRACAVGARHRPRSWSRSWTGCGGEALPVGSPGSVRKGAFRGLGRIPGSSPAAEKRIVESICASYGQRIWLNPRSG